MKRDKFETGFTRFMYTVLFLISFALSGLASAITPDASGEITYDITYFADLILTDVSVICLIVAMIMRESDLFKSTNPEYVASDAYITEFATKNYIPTIWLRFADVLNVARKKKQYHWNTAVKLRKLEDKARDQDRRLLDSTDPEDVKKRKKNRYCIRRAYLLKRLEQKYIDENIETINVKFDRITASLILGGYYDKKEDNQVNDFVTKNPGLMIVRDKAPTMLLSFALSGLASSVVLNIVFDEGAWFVIGTKALVFVWNAFLAIRYARSWTIKVLLKDIRFRRGVVTEYYQWVLQQAPTPEIPKNIVHSSEPKVIPEVKPNAPDSTHPKQPA